MVGKSYLKSQATKAKSDFSMTHNYFMPRTHVDPPTGPHKEFALRFREACARANLPSTLKGLAKTFDVSTATVHDWRHGEKLPSTENIIEISMITGVNYDWLATGRGSFHYVPSPIALEIARRIDSVEETNVVEYIKVLLDAAERKKYIK